MHISDFVECMNTELYSCIFQIFIFHLQVSCWSKVWINIKLLFIFHLYTFKFTGLEINKDSVSLKLLGWSLGTFSIISDLQQNIKTKIKTTTKKKYKPKHSQFYTDRIRGASANLIKKFWKQTIQPRFSDS